MCRTNPFSKRRFKEIFIESISSSNYLKSSQKEILLSGPLYDKSGKINEILLLSYPLNIKIIEHASSGSQSNLRINLLYQMMVRSYILTMATADLYQMLALQVALNTCQYII